MFFQNRSTFLRGGKNNRFSLIQMKSGVRQIKINEIRVRRNTRTNFAMFLQANPTLFFACSEEPPLSESDAF